MNDIRTGKGIHGCNGDEEAYNISLLSTGELKLYSGHTHNGAPHTEGVAFMLSRKVEKALVRLVMQQTT